MLRYCLQDFLPSYLDALVKIPRVPSWKGFRLTTSYSFLNQSLNDMLSDMSRGCTFPVMPLSSRTHSDDSYGKTAPVYQQAEDTLDFREVKTWGGEKHIHLRINEIQE